MPTGLYSQPFGSEQIPQLFKGESHNLRIVRRGPKTKQKVARCDRGTIQGAEFPVLERSGSYFLLRNLQHWRRAKTRRVSGKRKSVIFQFEILECGQTAKSRGPA